MIELLTAPTPNGWKISIMLEECGLPYEVRWINLGKGEQLAPDFLAASPNGRIPAIIDRDPADGGAPIPVFESAAILVYLAEKSGQFLPADPRGRKSVLEWLSWQVAGLGPMLGQHGHFKLYAPDRIAYATDRYRRETLRLYGVLDARLGDRDYLADGGYSIADMACFPWVQTYKAQEIDLAAFPGVQAWYERLKARPALRRGMALGRDRLKPNPQNDPETRRVLFGIQDSITNGERQDGAG